MRSLEITFTELKKYLEARGDAIEANEYIKDVSWQVAYPDSIVFVRIENFSE